MRKTKLIKRILAGSSAMLMMAAALLRLRK